MRRTVMFLFFLFLHALYGFEIVAMETVLLKNQTEPKMNSGIIDF